jgi:hypothetical protein
MGAVLEGSPWTDEDKVACRTPAEGRDGVTRIPAWKYEAVRRAILHAVDAAGAEGLRFADLPGAVRARLSQQELARLGSLGWHCTTVKLEMEVAGEIERVEDGAGQRLKRG